jgi:hypothetical protein
VEEGIGTLIIGKNPVWKQGVELGHKHNQEFVQIPHARITRALDLQGSAGGDPGGPDRGELHQVRPASSMVIPCRPTRPSREEKLHFSGKRDGRWYRASGERLLHSDVNGAYNIARKVVPTAFGVGIGAAAVRPRRLAALKRGSWQQLSWVLDTVTGLMRYWSAPAASPANCSCSRASADRMMSGMEAVSGSPRRARTVDSRSGPAS